MPVDARICTLSAALLSDHPRSFPLSGFFPVLGLRAAERLIPAPAGFVQLPLSGLFLFSVSSAGLGVFWNRCFPCRSFYGLRPVLNPYPVYARPFGFFSVFSCSALVIKVDPRPVGFRSFRSLATPLPLLRVAFLLSALPVPPPLFVSQGLISAFLRSLGTSSCGLPPRLGVFLNIVTVDPRFVGVLPAPRRRFFSG